MNGSETEEYRKNLWRLVCSDEVCFCHVAPIPLLFTTPRGTKAQQRWRASQPLKADDREYCEARKTRRLDKSSFIAASIQRSCTSTRDDHRFGVMSLSPGAEAMVVGMDIDNESEEHPDDWAAPTPPEGSLKTMHTPLIVCSFLYLSNNSSLLSSLWRY